MRARPAKNPASKNRTGRLAMVGNSSAPGSEMLRSCRSNLVPQIHEYEEKNMNLQVIDHNTTEGVPRPNISYITHPRTPFSLSLLKLINHSSRREEDDGDIYTRTHSKRTSVGNDGSRMAGTSGLEELHRAGSRTSEGSSRRSPGMRWYIGE